MAEVIEQHFPGTSEHDANADHRRAFCQAAEALATEYARRRQLAQEAEAKRRRYEVVALAARQLRFAMDELADDELTALGVQQEAAHHAYVSELDEHQSYDLSIHHDVSEEPYGPRPAKRMQEWQDLRWLEQGATLLCPPRKRGRPENTAERWVAREFVVLCHQHGWTPVRVAHSGSELGGGSIRPSSAVICLAAILVAGGEHEVRANSTALSALKLLRSEFTHVEWPAGSFKHPDHEPEPYCYTVNLQSMTRDRHDDFTGLPQFGPQAE